jgi:hypothetical protein
MTTYRRTTQNQSDKQENKVNEGRNPSERITCIYSKTTRFKTSAEQKN